MMADTTEEVVPDCDVKASSIKAIDKKSVHRICSGQVVLTLATAVKELVENSIDAGATSVEVKLKEYGSESIEVIDNGSGVKSENFEGLALKHHTSKLTEFDDLIHVETFGFRGEALSSLCALSKMAVTTRHESASIGTRLEFNMNGKIVNKKIIPKPVGTTVLLQDIFHTLPVRHKEFQRNLKKEFARLIQVLNAYCIINTRVRISCVNQMSKGNRTTVISTNCNTSMRDNLSNIFGSKQLHSLLEFKQMTPKEDTCLEYGFKMPQNSVDFQISGYISKCDHGLGRSSTDRQFIFINKRPCDATKILKLINEVYHMYNRHQYPLISLSIEMRKDSVDVNVTPDKRQMFLEGEKLLLAVLKSSLIELFEPTSSVYKMNNTCFTNNNISPFLDNNTTSCKETKRVPLLSSLSSPLPAHVKDNDESLDNSFSKLKRNFSSAFDKNKESPSTPNVFKPTVKKTKSVFSSSLSSFSRNSSNESPGKGSILGFFTPAGRKQSSLMENRESCDAPDQNSSVTDSGDNDAGSVDVKILKVENVNKLQNEIDSTNVGGPACENSHVPEDGLCVKDDDKTCEPSDEQGDHLECPGAEGEGAPEVFLTVGGTHEQHLGNDENMDLTDQDDGRNVTPASETVCVTEPKRSLSNGVEQEDPEFKRPQKETVVNFSLAGLRSRLETKLKNNDSSTGSSFSRAFRAKISPTDQKEAEEELQREISKDMFSKMEILGQFNLGFIIARLGSDLFIIDQHATDEKYNFEMLQRNHVLQSQKMIIPQNLELTSSNETILIDNLEVFKKNGFDFVIEPEAPPTQRVKLVSAPVSKNWSFGKDDIEELLFMLMDSPNVMCRPSRVRMMFASRACRKSIMIGTALNQHEMKKLVSHMGEIEQPWNCPHGRPTMRHLFNLNMLPA